MNKEEEAEFRRKIEMMWRGMYGEDSNEVIGVVDSVKGIKKDVRNAKKYIYMAMGFITAVTWAYFIIKELHIKLF